MNWKIFILLVALVAVCSLGCVGAVSSDNATLDLDTGSQSLEVPDSADVLSKVQSDEPSLSSTNLELDNDADLENIHIGDKVTWIVSVENKGPSNAKNVKVLDRLPNGLKFVKYRSTKGTFDAATGIWNIADLLNGSSAHLYITTKATSTGEKINRAYLTSDTPNTNDETYEEEEIDVFDYGSDGSSAEKPVYHAAVGMNPAGNPFALLLIGLVGCLVGHVKRKELH